MEPGADTLSLAASESGKVVDPMNRLLMSSVFAATCLCSSAFSVNPPPSPARSAPNEYNVEPADSIKPIGIVSHLSDDELLEAVQRQTFRYFWHYAHPNSGMARERSNTVRADFYLDYIDEANGEPNLAKGTFGPEACAVGGTGFGIMATIVAVESRWVSRDAALDRLIQIVDFLAKADSFHGIYPHFINGDTGKVIPFDRIDDGADIVETSYLMMGLLSARAYFNGNTAKERYLARRINDTWDAANEIGQPDARAIETQCALGAFDRRLIEVVVAEPIGIGREARRETSGQMSRHPHGQRSTLKGAGRHLPRDAEICGT
jgi:hypothetical protein